MIGAIAGDVIGSIHEGQPRPPDGFPLFTPRSRFTDDTVLTIAVASAIRSGEDYGAALRTWGRRYPRAGYGGWFGTWLYSRDPKPYGSLGNGSAMRVSPVGWAFDDLDAVLLEAERSAVVTHDHPQGIAGAQAVAAAVRLARGGAGKLEIATFLGDRFGYDCDRDLDAFRRRGFDVSCEETVPAAAAAFLRSTDFEGAVRNAVSLGGDADTLAAIAGAIAEAYYGEVPGAIRSEALRRLDPVLLDEVAAFGRVYGIPYDGVSS